jgi:vancomycin resistance protein YoaR
MPTSSPAAIETPAPARRPRWRRWSLLALLALVVLALLGGGALALLRALRSGALPGTEVGGVAVGGLPRDALREEVEALAARRASGVITATRGDERATAGATELGYELEVDATVEAVLARGRQANPLAALADQLRAFGGTITVTPAETIDERELRAWVARTTTALDLPATEATLRFDGATVTPVQPAAGQRVLFDPLTERARAALRGDGPATFAAPVEDVAPQTTLADLDSAQQQASLALSGPVRLFRGAASVTLDPPAIGSILSVSRDGGDLTVVVDPARLVAVLGPAVAAFESPPVPAHWRAEGETVLLIEAVDGFRFTPDATATQLTALLTAPPLTVREMQVAGETLQPALTTDAARALNITQRVSTFTTNHACCQNRVANIHRIADLVNGVLIRPGETFSVNEFVGPRTRANGFVADATIQDGEFVDEVGGGVSQFATTLFNAAFFGGYEIVEHKPHSQYISRYPAGREATLDYPEIDLKIRNSSPHGLLVAATYSGTSITVSMYASPWVSVEALTGPRRNPTPPRTIVRENNALPPGAEQMVQQGEGQGFDITVVRVRRFPDGREERDEFFTRYMAKPTIIERNT